MSLESPDQRPFLPTITSLTMTLRRNRQSMRTLRTVTNVQRISRLLKRRRQPARYGPGCMRRDGSWLHSCMAGSLNASGVRLAGRNERLNIGIDKGVGRPTEGDRD